MHIVEASCHCVLVCVSSASVPNIYSYLLSIKRAPNEDAKITSKVAFLSNFPCKYETIIQL